MDLFWYSARDAALNPPGEWNTFEWLVMNWELSQDTSGSQPPTGRVGPSTGTANFADGTRLQIWDCAGGGNQVWRFP